jgi:hypothetical protein
MKPQNWTQPGSGSDRRTQLRIQRITMEWVDPMSWKLSSGKALAEFALQAGFLAPLLLATTPLATPGPRKNKIPRDAGEAEVVPAIAGKRAARKTR